MSFWNINTTEDAGSFETGGGTIEPIPANTDVLAICDEAKWDQSPYDDRSYISLRWSVMKPEDFRNRKVFQKLRVDHQDPKKSEKAKRMLAAIDYNAGGKLQASGEDPTDESMTKHLTNKPMVLRLQVWEIETEQGEKKSGNWVSAVSPAKKAAAKPAAKPAEPTQAEIDSIPF